MSDKTAAAPEAERDLLRALAAAVLQLIDEHPTRSHEDFLKLGELGAAIKEAAAKLPE